MPIKGSEDRIIA